MSIYYVQLLYIHIMLKKCQNMSKLYRLGTKKIVKMKISHFTF